jgi:uroporphyrinogen-III synthase
MKLVITRPHLDAVALSEKLIALGHDVVIAPVLEIVPRQNIVVPDFKFQAICLTSANGIRNFTGDIDLNIPVFAVGEQSARAALDFGFINVVAKGGNVHGLVKAVKHVLISADGPLLYISGAETSGDLQGQLQGLGFHVLRLITYDAVAQDLAGQKEEILSSAGVLLYSPRSAKLWLTQMQKLNLSAQLSEMNHFCLSPQVASELSQYSHILIANSPSEDAMLTLLERRIGDGA